MPQNNDPKVSLWLCVGGVFLLILFFTNYFNNSAKDDNAIQPVGVLDWSITPSVTTPSQKTSTSSVSSPSSSTTREPNRPEYYGDISEEALSGLLNEAQSDVCVYPCYFGINPGLTSWMEAQNILQHLTGISEFQIKPAGQFTSYYLTLVPIASDHMDSSPKYLLTLGIFVDVRGNVQKIYSWYLTKEYGSFPKNYWNIVSPNNLLSTLGMPDRILSGSKSGRSLELLYTDVGIIGIYSPLWKNEKFCPGDPTQVEVIQLLFYNPNYPMDILSPINILSGAPGVDMETYFDNYSPIEQKIGISQEEFYKRLRIDPTHCFEVWQGDN